MVSYCNHFIGGRPDGAMLVGFYGISTFDCYLMSNSVVTYIKTKIYKRVLRRNILDK